MKNPFSVDEETFIERIDYFYRFALGEMWNSPSIWAEYWTFLFQNKIFDKVSQILNLATKHFGEAAFFHLKRASYMVDNGFYENALEIYHNIKTIKCQSSIQILSFRVLLISEGEEKVLAYFNENVEHAPAEVFMHAAKMVKTKDYIWAILQSGLGKFSNHIPLINQTNQFLNFHNEKDSSFVLLRQLQSGSPHHKQKICSMIFQNDVNRIAPLNIFEKTPEDLECEDVILDIQRYRFLDLYSLSTSDLSLVAHFTENHSIDLEANHENEMFTSIPPWRSDLSKLKLDQTQIDQIKKLANEPDSAPKPSKKHVVQQPFIPQQIYNLKRRIEQQQLPVPYTVEFDQLVQELTQYKSRTNP
jgi:hypothetical protein